MSRTHLLDAMSMKACMIIRSIDLRPRQYFAEIAKSGSVPHAALRPVHSHAALSQEVRRHAGGRPHAGDMGATKRN